jgi:hypothetical protein
MSDYRRELNERIARAERILPSLSVAARTHYCDEALVNLIDAGWNETRAWDACEVDRYERAFATRYPECAHRFVHEFGGLTIGIDGRAINVGLIRDYKYPSRSFLNRPSALGFTPSVKQTFFAMTHSAS